ncbi:MAG: M18 family aminopeptidase, partial [Hungatella sp.]
SDLRGGSTLGAISSSLLAMKAVDVGIPILAMHSARELMGTKDQAALVALTTQFFLV